LRAMARSLDEMKKKKFDLVRMDLRMAPSWTVFLTTEAIRKDIDKMFPIIALTAHGAETDRRSMQKSAV